MSRAVMPWRDVPAPVRRGSFAVGAALALTVVVGLALLGLAAAALYVARRGEL